MQHKSSRDCIAGWALLCSLRRYLQSRWWSRFEHVAIAAGEVSFRAAHQGWENSRFQSVSVEQVRKAQPAWLSVNGTALSREEVPSLSWDLWEYRHAGLALFWHQCLAYVFNKPSVNVYQTSRLLLTFKILLKNRIINLDLKYHTKKQP